MSLPPMVANKSAAPTTATANPADASKPGSEETASSTPTLTQPEFDMSATFDVEDLLAGPAPGVATPNTNTTEGLEDDNEAQPEAPDEPKESDADPDEPKTEDDDAEVVEDQQGKRLVGAKHFDRMRKQRDAAKSAQREMEAKLKEVEAKLAQVEDKPVVVSKQNDPLATVTNTEQLEAVEANAKAWRRWCRSNPLGGTPPIEGAEEMEPEKIAATLEWAEGILEAAPKRAQFLREFQENRQSVKKVLPQMFTPGTDEQRAYQQWQRKLLNFDTVADQDAIIAKLIKLEQQEREEKEGVARYTRVELKKQDGGKSPAKVVTTKPSPKSVTTTTTVPAVRSSTGSTPREAVMQKLAAPGASVDLEELYAAGL